MEKEAVQVGKIKHYFPKIGVAIVEVTGGSINTGDKIHIKGSTTDFRQKVNSMQVEHDKVDIAQPGQEIGLKVDEPAREHDLVFKET